VGGYLQQELIEFGGDMAKVEHGPEVAGYDNLGLVAYGHACPFITCLCGWQSNREARTWEDVGCQFDDHLQSV
jgi:hypothetical protein